MLWWWGLTIGKCNRLEIPPTELLRHRCGTSQADDATRSFYTKTLQTVHNPDTIADGARTPSLGQLTFPLVLDYVDDMVTVSEDAIVRTMFFLWERLKIVVEPTGVLAATALLEGIVTKPDARIGIIISGGNVDLKTLSHLLS